jgi:hypothetical protein
MSAGIGNDLADLIFYKIEIIQCLYKAFGIKEASMYRLNMFTYYIVSCVSL